MLFDLRNVGLLSLVRVALLVGYLAISITRPSNLCNPAVLPPKYGSVVLFLLFPFPVRLSSARCPVAAPSALRVICIGLPSVSVVLNWPTKSLAAKLKLADRASAKVAAAKVRIMVMGDTLQRVFNDRRETRFRTRLAHRRRLVSEPRLLMLSGKQEALCKPLAYTDGAMDSSLKDSVASQNCWSANPKARRAPRQALREAQLSI